MKSVPLRRVAHLAYGEALASDIREDGAVPVFSSGGQTGRHSRANTVGPTVVVGRKGSFGSTHWSNESAFVIDTAFFIDRNQTVENLRWLYYVLTSLRLDQLSGDVGVPGLSRELAHDAKVPMCSREEQRRISDFLDDQVTRIDHAVRLAQSQQSMLKDRLDSSWDTAVRELEERNGFVPLRRILYSIVDGPFGSSLASGHYSDSGTRVIRLGNVGRAEFRLEDAAYIPHDYARELSQHRADPGDLIVAGLGDETWPLGRAAVVPAEFGPAIVKADCYRVRLMPQTSHDYAALVLSSRLIARRTQLLSRGSTRSRLNTDVVCDIPIPRASPPEQANLASTIRTAMEHSKSLGHAMKDRISTLQERKRALITACVTGEFDVSTASNRASEAVIR